MLKLLDKDILIYLEKINKFIKFNFFLFSLFLFLFNFYYIIKKYIYKDKFIFVIKIK